MFVHNNLGLPARRTKTVSNEIHFCLYHCQVVLRPSLQHKAGAERSKIRNTRNVQENVLRKHGSQAGEDFLSTPPLTLKIHDVRLHENSAAIAKNWHGICRKCEVGVLVHVVAKSLGGGLQEISVAGGALRVELEILHAPVVQNDDLDVLTTHVHDYMWVLVELQR